MKAALLDTSAASGKAIFLRMVDVEPAELTDRHVATITECDLEPGRYVWVPSEDPRNADPPNPYGGTFVAKELLAAGVPLDRQGEFLDKAHANMTRALNKGKP
jgi:hypothetical protein